MFGTLTDPIYQEMLLNLKKKLNIWVFFLNKQNIGYESVVFFIGYCLFVTENCLIN